METRSLAVAMTCTNGNDVLNTFVIDCFVIIISSNNTAETIRHSDAAARRCGNYAVPIQSETGRLRHGPGVRVDSLADFTDTLVHRGSQEASKRSVVGLNKMYFSSSSIDRHQITRCCCWFSEFVSAARGLRRAASIYEMDMECMDTSDNIVLYACTVVLEAANRNRRSIILSGSGCPGAS